MTPTAETLATVAQITRQAMSLLGDDGADEPADDDGKSKLTPKQIERILREAGMTRGDARGVLAKGYNAIVAPREADGQELKTLCNLFNQFKL